MIALERFTDDDVCRDELAALFVADGERGGFRSIAENFQRGSRLEMRLRRTLDEDKVTRGTDEKNCPDESRQRFGRLGKTDGDRFYSRLPLFKNGTSWQKCEERTEEE